MITVLLVPPLGWQTSTRQVASWYRPTRHGLSQTNFAATVVSPSPAGNFHFAPNAFGDPFNGSSITAFYQAAIPMPHSNAVQTGCGIGGTVTIMRYRNGNATALPASGTNY